MRDDAMERDELDLLLDQQIDGALATYIDAEAKPGLAHSILAATSRREPRGRPALRWLAVAVPALAAVLLVAILVAHRANSPSQTAHVVAQAPSATPRTVLPAKPGRLSPLVARAVKVRDAHVAPSLPRREVFPTPVPLTAEEQALLAGRKPNSQQVSTQLAQSATRSEQPVEPIHIADIHIPPLNPPDNGGN